MLQVTPLVYNPFQENTYLVFDPASCQALIVDPGMTLTEPHSNLSALIAHRHLKVKYIINTHLHLDHSFGLAAMAAEYAVTPKAHPADFALAEQIVEQARMFGLPAAITSPPTALEPLHEGDILTLGQEEIHVLEVPGHTPGGLAFVAPQSGWVITGDSLFAGSIGRTDLPGGNHATLLHSLQHKLLTLPADTVVYPGHGPSTTIGTELHSNPYLC